VVFLAFFLREECAVGTEQISIAGLQPIYQSSLKDTNVSHRWLEMNPLVDSDEEKGKTMPIVAERKHDWIH